jgi:hypothetical protein
MALTRPLADPDNGRHHQREGGEVIVDEVRRHWVVYLYPALLALLALFLFWVFLVSPVQVAAVPLVAAGLVGAFAAWKALHERSDRFVITNMRVFRVKGVFARSLATMPLRRILDITVYKPLHGRILGFGHFIFESAAQEQGLREIRYVGRPDERDLAIQRVVQRSGLRGSPDVN